MRQAADFHSGDGYILLPGLLDAEAVASLRDETAELLARHARRGKTLAETGCVVDIFAESGIPAPHDAARTNANAYFAARSAALGRATSAAVRRAVESVLPRAVAAALGRRGDGGEIIDVRLFNEHCVVKPAVSDVPVGETLCEFRWHVDAAEQLQLLSPSLEAAQEYVSCWCALDDCDASNGSLAFCGERLSGTVGADGDGGGGGVHATAEIGGADEPRADAVGSIIRARAGDVVIFSARTWHRSGANTSDSPRRVYYAQYSRGPIVVGERRPSPLSFAVPTNTSTLAPRKRSASSDGSDAKRARRSSNASNAAAAVTATVTAMDALVRVALSRQRRRLTHATEYTHRGLRAWVLAALGGAGWSCASPQQHLCSPAAAWPAADAEVAAARALAALLPPALADQAADLLCGHCEEMAVLVTMAAAARLRGGGGSSGGEEGSAVGNAAGAALLLTDAAQRDVTERLGALPTADAVDAVFGAHRAGADEGWHSGPALWHAAAPVLCAPPPPPGSAAAGDDEVAIATAFVAGSPEAAARIRAAAAADEGGLVALPLYVVNYIFDMDELGAADMDLRGIETAQYSLHAVGLLLNRGTKHAYLCDPNGSLLRGGSMEFVAVPLRGSGRRPTTARSQSDVDDAALEAGQQQQRAGSKKRELEDQQQSREG